MSARSTRRLSNATQNSSASSARSPCGPRRMAAIARIFSISTPSEATMDRLLRPLGNTQAEAEGDLAATFAKIEGYAARFTLVHHVVTYASRGKSDLCPIEAKSVEAGIMLADWFRPRSRARLHAPRRNRNRARTAPAGRAD